MFDFIPIQSYTPLYYYLLLFIVLVTLLHTHSLPFYNIIVKRYNRNFGLLIVIFLLLYIGLRPINGVFIDMTTYAKQFERVSNETYNIDSFNDPLYGNFLFVATRTVTVNFFFFLCACLYIIPLFIICKKWFKAYWFYGFLFLITSFSFWAYGTNGIRHGIAGSLFLLGFSREKRTWKFFWLFMAINFHLSMLLPVIGYFLASLYNYPKKIIYFWLFCIPLSLLSSGAFETFFGSLGFADERINYLTTEANAESFSSTGFRWDFLFYSGVAVFAGWYYIVKLKLRDQIYNMLFITYTFSNAFWILVIRANFSNRFAYLSWFMMALIIIYPLLKHKLISEQHKKIGLILFIYFFFTFFMNVIKA